MKVSELMTHPVRACRAEDSCSRAAQLMWEFDCGALPVVDDHGVVTAMITDRDICMAAYTQGRRLVEIPVRSASSQTLYAVRASDGIDAVERLMQVRQIRRVPVVDEQNRLVGIVSLNDLALHQHRGKGRSDGLEPDAVARTLASVCQPSSRHATASAAS